MNYQNIFDNLHQNKAVFQALLGGVSQEVSRWRQQPGKWCLLEIVCHLYDEEREDFRTRLKYALETPETPPPPFDPVAWVSERNYIRQDYQEKLEHFLKEREASLRWLRSLSSPQWSNAFQHPKFGPMSAQLFLSNWLAHDFLHIRQIVRLKYNYLKEISGEDLGYAGNW